MSAVLLAILKFPFFLTACALWLVLAIPLLALDGVSGGHRSRRYGGPKTGESIEVIDEAERGWLRGFVNIWQAFYGPGMDQGGEPPPFWPPKDP